MTHDDVGANTVKIDPAELVDHLEQGRDGKRASV